MWSLRVVVVLLCSSLNDDLCRLNLVLNSFSVSPMYVSCFFVSVSVTVALYTTHLVRHFPSSGQLFFCRQLYIYIYIYINRACYGDFCLRMSYGAWILWGVCLLLCTIYIQRERGERERLYDGNDVAGAYTYHL